MFRRLGLSIYPDNSKFEEDLAYLKLGNKHGFERIFMSMLEVTEGKEKVAEKFSKIIKEAKMLNYEVILDIAPNIFDELAISYDDLSFFHQLGADGLRLDVGFDGNKEANLSFNPFGLVIELNMSNDVAYLDNILSYKANKPYIYGCHNFYPQEGSALPLEFFEKCSQRFKKQGIRTAAFVTSQTAQLGPWDINDGLPTLEMHRHLPISLQAKHLFATELIDDVIIGNAYASEDEIDSLGKINRYQTEFSISFEERTSDIEKNIVLNNQHFRRGDITQQMIRSTQTRKDYKNVNPAHDNKEVFQKGDILIGNDDFGKYKNELQIALEPHSDPRKNKVGSVAKEELILLDYIQPWSKFLFKEV
ncbi:DUF871 domain-containing protein [Lactococcus formosensis]|uniref:MupG family TIM beta-alpha barrel fold protein n=1 Tax=Lactococcus formosensis TaxID=1281486 RepID=A0A9X4SG66_9LACT|nr:MupG family TIM beta-alpha barrel fold protein [Lactococcus formosensis]MDG6142937.1 MupG family TIM beta-alpha barrel fold protein [Lactococcus formosensis]MDG6156230.1 MupG family TIM beta-alpha barrel fold protein [Lactococcus formosensis]MDG6160413.1 MupG family TIM beta-alpha barrel fold protein [Lactococcus formosensis]MDG6167044.1 MupG family TIM beta-alpha barrel fold protein [Lactococcus formosensis]MDG6173313.1 MupG family TIM beta-alpha barrel fold protein [Lactococcus formosensi